MVGDRQVNWLYAEGQGMDATWVKVLQFDMERALLDR